MLGAVMHLYWLTGSWFFENSFLKTATNEVALFPNISLAIQYTQVYKKVFTIIAFILESRVAKIFFL